ncbi:hypothetical protein TraAM80_00404 [Trypanosoma rangeli]|uniref:Uncharacterized protein n=1 Tax=Trypanosoma rangeli TaxID=5698 RepID=A0A422P3E8_TRYRA|nr:uncharacterized protein TraAM80_00404 [Trypanosoma rangeli]RNF12257.1 hypothetical protein TraAM80_00404 [Trypanosoma rangeli]|eukprot:RNF12257.1 hypothetical protein TraAM80_00404 [Trypanosoma rangeli]
MDDALMPKLLRLVRNGRTPLKGCNVFIFGNLQMLDLGPCFEDEEALQAHRSKKGMSSEVALVVSVKGAVAEIWRFQDYRVASVMSPNSKASFSTAASQGVVITEQQWNSLEILIRVIFAYLRIHEIFVDIADIDASDIVLRLVVDMDELPRLEKDSCVRRLWAVEGLVSVSVTYNQLWRAFLKREENKVMVSNAAATAKGEIIAEQRVGTALVPCSESVGSGRSILTPHFAPGPLPSSVGSSFLLQKWPKSPTLPLSDFSLPLTSTAVADNSYSYYKTPSQGAVAAAVAAHGTRTQAVRGYTFASVPTFAAHITDSHSDRESDTTSSQELLHELLEVCEVSLHEATISIHEVLAILEKKPLCS